MYHTWIIANYSSLITGVCQFGAAVGAISTGYFVWRFFIIIIFRLNMVRENAFMDLTLFSALVLDLHWFKIFQWYVLVDSFLVFLQVLFLVLYQLSVKITVLNHYLVNELSPIELKGPLGTFTQILVTTGILLAFVMGVPIPTELSDYKYRVENYNSDDFFITGYWRIMFAIPIVLSLI